MNKTPTRPRAPLPIRGYLLHLTHYDPVWCANKEKEKPFDLKVGLELIDAMAEAGLNLLLIDTKDGVRYESHPELARPYTQPMHVLRALVALAAEHGIDVAIKLNFSQSALHRHNDWFRPHNGLFDSAEYWKLGFEVIDELISVARPARFFHIGMDEDHSRSYRQYIAAIGTLHAGLKKRDLRTVIWNDSACGWPAADIHKEKSLLAEELAPKDVIHVVWDYAGADPKIFRRIRTRGLDVWGAPGGTPELVGKMRDTLRKCGGTGIVLTRWAPCIRKNRDLLLTQIRTLGPLCGQ